MSAHAIALTIAGIYVAAIVLAVAWAVAADRGDRAPNTRTEDDQRPDDDQDVDSHNFPLGA